MILEVCANSLTHKLNFKNISFKKKLVKVCKTVCIRILFIVFIITKLEITPMSDNRELIK